MTLDQFYALDELEQTEAIWEHGVEIAKRWYSITLYQIDSFYVEVWHHIEHNVDKLYHIFSSTIHLTPYTDTVDISGLLNKE